MASQGASLRPLYLTTALLSLAVPIYVLGGIQPSPLVMLALAFGPAIAGLVWFRRDARARGVRLVHDWGFLALALWFVFLPWYAVSTRGWRGVGLLARVLLALLAPWLLWVILATIRYASYASGH